MKWKRRKTPVKPVEMNGEHAAIWNMLLHLNGRIDAQYAIQVAILLSIVGTLAVVILK